MPIDKRRLVRAGSDVPLGMIGKIRRRPFASSTTIPMDWLVTPRGGMAMSPRPGNSAAKHAAAPLAESIRSSGRNLIFLAQSAHDGFSNRGNPKQGPESHAGFDVLQPNRRLHAGRANCFANSRGKVFASLQPMSPLNLHGLWTALGINLDIN